MSWQWVVITVAVLALFCFYQWCNTNLHISNNHRIIMEKQAEIAQSNVEYARLQSGVPAVVNETTD